MITRKSWGTAEGHVEIQVARADAQRALEVLEVEPEPRETVNHTPTADHKQVWGSWASEDVERCLVCQGSLVRVEPPSLPLRALRFVLTEFLSLPEALFRGRGRVCDICGHRWRTGDVATTEIPADWH